MPNPVEASCHCGAVRLRLAAAPETMVDCNCSLCRRYGVLWAYYDDADVTVLAEPLLTDTYAWNGRHVDFHRCRTCGCVVQWTPRDARTRRGINARLLEPEILAAARLRHRDGANTGKFLD